MRDLHEHQAEALHRLKLSVSRGKRRPVMQAPTGYGKTVLASAITEGALKKGKRVIFCVPQLSLIDQTVDQLWADGIQDIGVIQANHERTAIGQPVQVASIQTLMRRDIPLADVVIVDECHRLYNFVTSWMARPEWKDVPFIGLSATPWTKGLGKFYDDLIVAATTADMIEKGYLSKFKVLAPDKPNLKGIKTVAGDYHEGQLSELMNKVELVANVVETWKTRASDLPTLCFAVDRAHASSLQAQFEKENIPCGYIDAFTDRKDREEIRKQFHNGDVKVVVNVGCLTMGVDWDVRCIILARPTKSEILFVQIIGRGLRTATGKDHCLILDHSDTHNRLGFVTDIHHETLDDGEPKSKASAADRDNPLPKECPSCSFLKPAGQHVCPYCGFAPQKAEGVTYLPGQLIEKHRHGKGSIEHKKAFYAGLLYIAEWRNKSDKWVLANYRQKFKEWPQWSWRREIAPEASAEVGNFVKWKTIAWVRGKERREAEGKQELIDIARESGAIT